MRLSCPSDLAWSERETRETSRVVAPGKSSLCLSAVQDGQHKRWFPLHRRHEGSMVKIPSRPRCGHRPSSGPAALPVGSLVLHLPLSSPCPCPVCPHRDISLFLSTLASENIVDINLPWAAPHASSRGAKGICNMGRPLSPVCCSVVCSRCFCFLFCVGGLVLHDTIAFSLYLQVRGKRCSLFTVF